MALVLTRRAGESILVGDDCFVTVHSIQGNQVQLLLKCPDSVRIVRTELLSRPKKDEQDDQDLA